MLLKTGSRKQPQARQQKQIWNRRVGIPEEKGLMAQKNVVKLQNKDLEILRQWLPLHCSSSREMVVYNHANLQNSQTDNSKRQNIHQTPSHSVNYSL